MEKTKEQLQKEFTDASLSLIKYLAENHHPHTTVIVTNTNAELLEGQMSTGEILGYINESVKIEEIAKGLIQSEIIKVKILEGGRTAKEVNKYGEGKPSKSHPSFFIDSIEYAKYCLYYERLLIIWEEEECKLRTFWIECLEFKNQKPGSIVVYSLNNLDQVCQAVVLNNSKIKLLI